MIDERLPGHGHNVAEMRKRKILIDGSPETGEGLLLQIFTENMIGPIFFEIIKRQGHQGFGCANINALLESNGPAPIPPDTTPPNARAHREHRITGPAHQDPPTDNKH